MVKSYSMRPPMVIAHCGPVDSDMAQANALLIAAAPDLLSAAKDTVEYLEKLVERTWTTPAKSQEVGK